jgi:hypothetical protein
VYFDILKCAQMGPSVVALGCPTPQVRSDICTSLFKDALLSYRLYLNPHFYDNGARRWWHYVLLMSVCTPHIWFPINNSSSP